MVYRKRKYTRRPVRIYRRKKYVRRMKLSRPIGSGEDGKRYFKLRHVINAIGHTTNVADIFNDNPSTYPDFDSIAALFDKYRVNAIAVKFIPTVTANTTVTGSTVFTPGYILHDENHATVSLNTSNGFLQYENCKVVNLQRPWKYYRKMKRNIPMEPVGNTLDTKGYQPTVHPVATQCFAFFNSSFDDGEQFGTFVVSLYITATARI